MSGYSINSRMVPKLFKIGASNPDDDSDAHIVLAVVGFAADGNALRERLDTIVKMYRHQHNKPISLEACAQRLSHILYQKRFFPFYVTCILGGLDVEGKGALFSYDPVGSYERESCRAAGAASSLIMPFLDVSQRELKVVSTVTDLIPRIKSSDRTYTSLVADKVTTSNQRKLSHYLAKILRNWCKMLSRAP